MSPIKSLRILLHRMLMPLGIDTRKLRSDRKILEGTVFPVLENDPNIQSILFVGCDWYTLHYGALFRQKRFITMEINPELARYGSEEHHIDSCENIPRLFPSDSLDCCILNGVFGFGLNERAAMETTLAGIYGTLRPGGWFLFGWNDLPEHRPFPIEELVGLDQFQLREFPGLGSIYESDPINRHRFHFYTKQKIESGESASS